MPLPTNPQSRKKIARAVVALMKLPPERRKALLDAQMKKRGLKPQNPCRGPDSKPV